jgi:ferredoxin
MKVIVDMNTCEYHGQCEIAAPDVFELRGEDDLVWDAEPPEHLRADVEAAVDVCPTQAISIED